MAVSGGVDSMVLLYLLANKPGVKLIVAHFDHGIRDDSAADRRLVQQAAKHYGLPFVYDQGQLGSGASEAEARVARYEFLRHVHKASKARAIVTAHHKDDLLETAIINILRGTNRRGLTSLRSRGDVVRPLLKIAKQELIAYAKANQLSWREDSTNQDTRYIRNYVRHRLITLYSPETREYLLTELEELAELNDRLDTALINQLHTQPGTYELDRHWFIMLPHAAAREIMATWLRERGAKEFDAKRLELLTIAAKTFESGKRADVDAWYYIEVGKGKLALMTRDR